MRDNTRVIIHFEDGSTDTVGDIANYTSASNMATAYLAMPRVKSVEIIVTIEKG